MTLQGLIDFFGYGLCHQIPERCFQASGFRFAACARCTGIHIGFAAALIAAALQFAWLRRRGRAVPGNLPPVPIVVLLVLLMLPMALDGLSSYIGLRPTTNLIRYLTGACAGLGTGSLVAPILAGMRADTDLEARAFSTWPSLAGHLLPAAALAAAFYLSYQLVAPAALILAVLALLSLVVSLNLLVLSVTAVRKRITRPRNWLPWLAASLACALAELAACGLIRLLILDNLLNSRGLWALVEALGIA